MEFTKEELEHLHYGLSVAIDNGLLGLLEITELREKIKLMIKETQNDKA